MDAMIYEMIIRFANDDCGRYGAAGANADIYRNLAMSEAMYRETQGANGQGGSNETTLNFGIALGEVTAYLTDAKERIKRKYNDRLDDNQREVLSNATLVSPTLEAVNNTMESVSSLIPILRELD